MSSRAPHATLLPAIAAASLAALVLARSAAADQVVVQALKDNTLFSQSGSLSDGKGTGLFAGVTGGSATRRALLAFDVAAAIPAGATIISAQLTLQVTMSNAGSEMMALHRLVADWGEGTSNSNEMGGGMGAAAATGDATWHFRFFDSQQWSTDGGDFVAATSAVKAALNSGPVTWGSTAQMVADVQGWLDAPEANFGWIVRGNEAANGTAKRFASREAGNTASRPKLTIIFDPPGGAATATASATPSPTMPAPTTSATPTQTRTAVATDTGTATVTRTPTATVTVAATITVAAATPTTSSTATATVALTTPPTSAATPTLSPSLVATAIATATPSVSPTDSPPPTTIAATSTATATPSATATSEIAATATNTPSVGSCVGDCDGRGNVTISELILGVNIALGSQPTTVCAAFDPSGSGGVEINELIVAVNNALAGC